ncbi:MAG: alpha/beta hydrolase [Clostridiales bacterium]|nr:alpha/beta hydrolase [Clostridiales bacterium]
MKKPAKILLVLIAVFLLLASATLIYANDYYHAVETDKYLRSDDNVKVEEKAYGYYFDGQGTENALIFYPGGKVDEKAYAPLLHSLATKGVDCFLLKMPLNLAVLEGNKAKVIFDGYDYENYYLAGHSLGGVMASSYASRHEKDVSGLFMLGAYTASDLKDAQFPVVFIYGSNDKIMDREKFEENISLVPDSHKTVVIDGGNHSQFGSYGVQEGDGKASIPAEKQWEITTDEILKIIG